jgi:transposase-like protein
LRKNKPTSSKTIPFQHSTVRGELHGVYFNIRLEDDRSCILVLMDALEDGRKEVIAVQDGYRESQESWRDLLADLKRRGLKQGPKLAVGDGALGFWGALSQEFGPVQGQRCWVHKTANVLDKMPKSVQANAKKRLHDISLAPTKKEALRAFDEFVAYTQTNTPKPVIA